MAQGWVRLEQQQQQQQDEQQLQQEEEEGDNDEAVPWRSAVWCGTRTYFDSDGAYIDE